MLVSVGVLLGVSVGVSVAGYDPVGVFDGVGVKVGLGGVPVAVLVAVFVGVRVNVGPTSCGHWPPPLGNGRSGMIEAPISTRAPAIRYMGANRMLSEIDLEDLCSRLVSPDAVGPNRVGERVSASA